MRQIYTNARQLIIWLGEPTDSTTNDLAFDVLDRLMALITKHAQGQQLRLQNLFQDNEEPYLTAKLAI